MRIAPCRGAQRVNDVCFHFLAEGHVATHRKDLVEAELVTASLMASSGGGSKVSFR